MSPQRFWMVLVSGRNTPAVRHPSSELAGKEAQRLSQKYPGTKVYVLESKEFYFTIQIPMKGVFVN